MLREADARGWERFHLVGYSGGGAAALAVTAATPSGCEPRTPGAGLGRTLGPQPGRGRRSGANTTGSRPSRRTSSWAAFMRLNVKPGVELLRHRRGILRRGWRSAPAGSSAFMQTFRTYDLDRDALARFDRPVYFALGGLSNPDQFGEIATRLGGVFPDFQLEVFEERHHFDPPHRIEPERLADSLTALWRRAEATS